MTSEVSDVTGALDAKKMNLTSAKVESKDVVVTTETETQEYNPVQTILDGFMHFRTNYYDKYPEMFDELALGQEPKFLVFACSDSRVSPSHVLHCQPGEAFLIRNIANMVPVFDQLKHTGVGAVLEYAVEKLEVENILVMGHSTCGGIERLMSYPEDGSAPMVFIDEWVKMGTPVKERVIAEEGHLDFLEQCEICNRGCVNLSLTNLLTYPFVQKAYSEKKLALRGGYYDFVNGRFELWEHGSDDVIVAP